MKQVLKKKIIIPFLVLIVFISTTAFQNDFFEIAKQIEIFTTLFKELNMNYVDETNPGDLMDTAIKSMLSDLDPYTNFMNEQDVEAARINNTGDYTGIGARVKTFKHKLLIVEPYKDYPADRAGLKAGDEIIKVGNTVVETYKDNAGDLLNTSMVAAMYSYRLKFGNWTYVNFGLQASYIQTKLNWNNLVFGDMIDPNQGVVGQTSEIPPANNTIAYPDFDFGIAFSYKVNIRFRIIPHEILLNFAIKQIFLLLINSPNKIFI